jgi:hypothetical protein
MMVKIVTQADVPVELLNDWLQHLRDFDTAHPGCHFECAIDALDMPMDEAIEMLKVDPPLSQLLKLRRKR